MEGLFCLYELLHRRRLNVQARYERCLYFSSTATLGIMFGFDGHGIFTSSSVYASAWDQHQESSKNGKKTRGNTKEGKYLDSNILDDMHIVCVKKWKKFSCSETISFLQHLLFV